MAAQADQVYKTSADIVAEVLAALLVRLPDANTGADSLFRIWTEIFGNTTEGLYLGMQLLHDDMFVQTASALALIRSGEMYGREQKVGLLATGSVTFAGTGGTYIPIGTIVSAPRASDDDALDFQTTVDGSIPNPGIPTAPVAADAGAGALGAGSYEYAVTFITAGGETAIGAISNALTIAASHNVNLTAIPLGGAGTTARKLYRRVNGGAWGNVDALNATLANNTTTTATDSDTSLTGTAPTVSTAEQITLAAQASEVGTDSNVAASTITDLSSAATGLSSVTNAAPFTGGANAEDIEAFRTALLGWVRAPQSGGPDDLVAWAEAIDGVETATVFPNVDLSGTPTPGTVTVRISGPGGTVPSAGVVAAVQADLQARDLANITILVGTFSAHNISLTAATTLAAGYILADVTPSAQAAISAYITSVPVGGTVYKAGVIDAVFGLPGIVNVTTAFTDTVLAATEKAIPATITIT
jgi:uncharacterized phage protein gp47/JayE